ncbi:MAG TPA: AAA family ATPase, partial [Smithellaceae bacterium]|nr:AAA family ATPase [Smithellaceae bacterium]
MKNLDLFSVGTSDDMLDTAPLAERMRPQKLEDYIGQPHLTSEGTLLRRAIAENKIFSMIFWGPPGSGKTTLARILATETKTNFVSF